jgi:lipopolysaccharide/colanic/teichoic acid biosynthesis glycosyltransferase
MFQLRTVARWSDHGVEPFVIDVLDRKFSDQPAVPLNPDAKPQEHPVLVAQTAIRTVATQDTSPDPVTRAFDIVVACAGLVFFAPLMAFIALAILLTSPGPIFFRQRRLGLGGRTFTCLKFRTMRTDAAQVFRDLLSGDPLVSAEWERTFKLRRDPRVSRLGTLLRKTSLDELPQFFNVLAGDMSAVGPRPIVPEEACRYGRHISSYYAVKPGITGLWQVSGRNNTTYRRRIACDVSYVRNRSRYGDFAIIAMTVPVVLLGRGAY